MFLSSRQQTIAALAICIIIFGNVANTLNVTITEELGTSLLVSGAIALFLGVAAHTINQPNAD